MATVRVFLLTFRRSELLPRAIESLRGQTLRDWVCEVHNGDPADPFPGEHLARVGDPRFRLVTPPAVTGPVEAFNLAHHPAPEPYQSILEDDNWWEPSFLATMVAALAAHPEVELAWCNLRVWEEGPNHDWRDTGRSVWGLPADAPSRLLHWPQLIQFSDCLYSNGAMLLRSRTAAQLIIPADTPVDMIEQTRERQMSFPILLLPAVLVHYSLTARTMRTTNYLGWGQSQALLGASFLASVPLSEAARRELWRHRRTRRPRATNGLIYAGLLQGDFGFLRGATAGDWLAFGRGCVRRPWVAWKTLRTKRRLPSIWRHLLAATARRTEEARQRGFTRIDGGSLLDKENPPGLGARFD
jgi:Glycosyl transferase family 2